MKIKLSKSQWEEMGNKAGWIKTSKIGKGDVELIIEKVNDIWGIMGRLRGTYKFVPESQHLRSFQLGMEKVLPYAEAKSKKELKKS